MNHVWLTHFINIFRSFIFHLFQELEQEKYHLRRRLQAAEEEYDLRVAELQSDINSLRKSLEEATVAQRQSEKEKDIVKHTVQQSNNYYYAQHKHVTFW